VTADRSSTANPHKEKSPMTACIITDTAQPAVETQKAAELIRANVGFRKTSCEPAQHQGVYGVSIN
jgi:hypothetical protein